MNESLSFREYQRLAAETDVVGGEDLHATMVPLLGLSGEVGSLLSEYKKFLREGERYRPFTDHVSEEIGDILWYLANLAGKAGLDLEDVAQENLAKVNERWAAADTQQSAPSQRRYDAAYPPQEQLPRRMRVEFREVATPTGNKLQLSSEEGALGDPLTDNAHARDGYRYHDVFHLTNAVLLGWSPVVRKLLSVKRKSNRQVDEVEDGARAAVTEEAISAAVFGHAKDHSFFEGADSVDYELLRLVKLMTRAFEVRDRSPREWERAILRGFVIWREMAHNHGGILVGDADQGAVWYERLSDTPFHSV